MTFDFEQGKTYMVSCDMGKNRKTVAKRVRDPESTVGTATFFKKRLTFNRITDDKKYDFFDRDHQRVFISPRNIVDVEEVTAVAV